ncbi:MAG: ceramidase domain-containing protein [Gammaproteobacteria bacterium]|nr:MAG: ceramidase domain-containing protein [Gammaproteobacteria bacterium]
MRERTWSHVARHWREITLVAIIVVSAFVMMLPAPIAQSLAYHDFADSRSFWGIPNFLDVATNILFLIVGVLGLVYTLRHPQPEVTWSWIVVFLGIAAVSPGSVYYHWEPNNRTLVWDRLPMTIAFMGLIVALLSEHMSPRIERLWLLPALVVGLASVIYWHYSDDLRPYIWVQAAPFLVVAVAMVLFEGTYTHRRYLVYGVLLYALAKVAEFYDGGVYSLTQQLISGHSLKHLLAGVGAGFLYLMLTCRHAVHTASSGHQPPAGR